MRMNDLPATQWTLARRVERMNPSVIREILKVTERPGIISFAGGLPSPRTFLDSPGFNQRLVAEVMKGGFLDRHVPTIRALYKSQCQAMVAALQREMQGLDVQWNTPDGGMFLWVRLPHGLDATELLPKAVERGVAFVPGDAFFAGEADGRCMRLSFVTASAQQIDTGIAALAAAIREQLARA